MFRAPLTKEDYDECLPQFIKKRVLKRINSDQDYLHLNVGMTGTGKTSLALFKYELYEPEPEIKYVALNRPDYARALKAASEKRPLRFTCWDEADANRRDALSKFNKDAMSLNWKIRGKSIFQIWNNPTAEWLDRPFIEEKIDSMIYVLDKSTTKPRRYLFFKRSQLLRLLEEQGNLKHDTLRKYGPKHALYLGWFRQYKGKLWKEYLAKKTTRMDDGINEFYEKYGKENDDISIKSYSEQTGHSRNTIKKHMRKLGITALTTLTIPMVKASIDGETR